MIIKFGRAHDGESFSHERSGAACVRHFTPIDAIAPDKSHFGMRPTAPLGPVKSGKQTPSLKAS